MLTRNFSIIGNIDQNESLQLVLEIGQQHITVVQLQQTSVTGIEIFRFTPSDNSDAEALVDSLLHASEMSRADYATITIYFNHPDAVLVPVFKFNKEIAEDYLQIAFGPAPDCTRMFDNSPGAEIMNVFRISNDWKQAIERRFKSTTIKHSFTSMIQSLLGREHTGCNMTIHFYHQQFVVGVSNESSIQLVQSIPFETHEDVAYTLLNICRQLQLDGDLTIWVSGFIDLHSAVYTELLKYFDNVQVETIESPLLTEQGNGHPAHYFTPFFKLAL